MLAGRLEIEGNGGSEGRIEDGIGGEERDRRIAEGSDGGEFGKDEMRVGVGRETGLDWFEIEEFAVCGGGGGREEERRSEASGDEGFAKRSVGAPNHIGWVGKR